ncbi:hypothetical protein PCASD_08165 [Puccinia coronata f. sp. avenae]|uniref:Myb/SANT-like domain-containing protein n=1 Tax=Puccinia coronata f. sp. avenae TaxID=200324 RepID=A0A2N5VC86_9BASI|nr:hypothetical protein PCASD_08165 [Puccinia coronata f. sp. avenae]
MAELPAKEEEEVVPEAHVWDPFGKQEIVQLLIKNSSSCKNHFDNLNKAFLKQATKKLCWTGPMEVMLLELYVQEVEKGKRNNNGFQNTSHQHVAQQLREAFPETKFLLDYNKCKSKLNQSFRCDYNLFLALKEASRFGWDEIFCEFTSSKDVWERYVAVHPNTQKFWGIPFPKFQNLDKIFGTSLATGKESRSLLPRLLGNSQPVNPNVSGNSGPNNAANSPTAYLSRSHSAAKKESVAGAIKGLAIIVSGTTPVQSNTRRALELYQEVHAVEGSQNQALGAFKIFQDNLNSKIFISIQDAQLRTQWLHKQID